MKNTINRYAITSFVSVILVAILISCGSTSPSNQPSGQTERTTNSNQVEFEKRQNIYMKVLSEEGYVPRDENSFIVFKRQGENFFLYSRKDEPSFITLYLPGIVFIESNEERQKAVIATGNVNRTTKVAKAYIAPDTNGEFIALGVELFLENPEEFRIVFPRMISAIGVARDRIFDEMK